MEPRPEVAILSARFAALKAGKALSRSDARIEKKATAAASRARRSIRKHLQKKRLSVPQWDTELKEAEAECARLDREHSSDVSLKKVFMLDCALASFTVDVIRDRRRAALSVCAQMDDMCSRLQHAL